MGSNTQSKRRAVLFGTTILAGGFVAGLPAFAQEAMETVTVTGYRASLQDSTNAKRQSVGFSDAVFAEDIGKFPDTNIAESLNRIPGVVIVRETDGSGMRIAIRGLGTDFTKVLLNNTVVATGGTGPTDAQGAQREVDLQMFPTELFTQLTVSKSQDASMIEGGASGVVNMRTMRPFDNPGLHVTYMAQGSDYSKADTFGYRGTLIGSYTDGPFGILVGLSGQQNNVMTTGYETIGLTNLNLTAPQFYTAAQIGSGSSCTALVGYTGLATNTNSCNPTGGDTSWSLPGTVPTNANIPGVAAGTAINQALLAQLNPDVTMTQLSNGIIPRLGRYMYQKGSRDRYNGVISLEYRPTDGLHFYVDMIGARTFNDIDRSDMDLVGRYSNLIPANMHVDQDNIVRSATFYNAQFFLEARPYKERADYVGVNPGFEWQATELLHVDGQVNWSESNFFRDSPTILVSTPGNYGTTVQYTANPGAPPVIAANKDLSDPANFGWSGGRLNLSQEGRHLYTKGFHVNAQYGSEELNLKAGVAYDEVFRNIRGYNNDDWWQASVCGGNPSFFLPAPNSRPACDGVNATHPANYSGGGWGTGYSAGQTVTWQGSLIPNSALPNYLHTGPTGFLAVDYEKFKEDSHYDFYAHNAPADVFHYDGHAPFSTGTNTNLNAGQIMEATTGYYAELNGILHRGEQKIRYNIGTRWIRTHQVLTGAMSVTDTRNAALSDGGRHPNTIVFPQAERTYNALLPSASLVWELSEDLQIRAALSRTMTRAFPNVMLPNMTFGDVSAAAATLGNVNLRPYFSNNIDLGAELYTGGEGYVGVAVFRKMITGFTYNQVTNQPFSYLGAWGITYNTLSPTQQGNLGAVGRAGSPAGCNSDATCANTQIAVTQAVNNNDIQTINGMELNWVQPLDFFLKDWGLEGFGFTANATFIRIKAPASNANVVLGVPKFTYNATGYYENYGLSVHMSYTWNDGSVSQRSPQNNMDLPQYGAPRGQADFSASYKLNEIFGDLPSDPQVTFDAQNLFHSKFRGYMGGQAGTYTYYNPGSVFLFGVRGSF